MAEQIRRVLVWSGWLRVAHWALAGSTVLLLVTGWLVAESPALAVAASDVHYLGAGLLVAALVLRVVLGFTGKGAERFEHVLLSDTELPVMRSSLVFYLTLGRAPMPNWFAHNPLWKPLYLILLLALVMAALSGWFMPSLPLLGPFYLPTVHAWLSDTIAVLVLLHVFSVVLQDLRGGAADTSAMIGGYRYFTVNRDAVVKPDVPQVSISLKDIDRQ